MDRGFLVVGKTCQAVFLLTAGLKQAVSESSEEVTLLVSRPVTHGGWLLIDDR